MEKHTNTHADEFTQARKRKCIASMSDAGRLTVGGSLLGRFFLSVGDNGRTALDVMTLYT